MTRLILCLLILPIANAASGQSPDAAPPIPQTRTDFTLHHQAPEGLEDVYEFYQQNFGFVPNLTKVMAGSPALTRSYFDTQNNLRSSGKLSQAELNVVQMSIAVENKCEYCTAGHTMVGKAFYKTPDDVMQSIRVRKIIQDPKLNALRNFAILVYMRKGEVGEDVLNDFLKAGYTREHALDVVACVAAKVMSNYANSLARTPLDPPLSPFANGLPFNEMAGN